MNEASKLKEEFLVAVVGSVYDAVDMTCREPLEKVNKLNSLKLELKNIIAKKTEISQLSHSPSATPQTAATLSETQIQRAQDLQKCLKICSRLTATQSDSQGRLLSGGVVLKNGNSFDGLQANWDLIDTVTGADA